MCCLCFLFLLTGSKGLAAVRIPSYQRRRRGKIEPHYNIVSKDFRSRQNERKNEIDVEKNRRSSIDHRSRQVRIAGSNNYQWRIFNFFLGGGGGLTNTFYILSEAKGLF